MIDPTDLLAADLLRQLYALAREKFADPAQLKTLVRELVGRETFELSIVEAKYLIGYLSGMPDIRPKTPPPPTLAELENIWGPKL